MLSHVVRMPRRVRLSDDSSVLSGTRRGSLARGLIVGPNGALAGAPLRRIIGFADFRDTHKMTAHTLHRLNARSLSRLKPGRHSDGNGLMLHVRRSGSRSWVQRIMVQGRRVDLCIGSASLISLADARVKAAENRRIARVGADPRTASSRLVTLTEAAEGAYAERSRQWRGGVGGSSARNWRQHMKHIEPRIGRLPVRHVGTAAVKSVLLPSPKLAITLRRVASPKRSPRFSTTPSSRRCARRRIRPGSS